MLTSKQISEYWENGFSFPHTAFSEEKAQEYFDKFLELEEKFGTDRVRNDKKEESINSKMKLILRHTQY